MSITTNSIQKPLTHFDINDLNEYRRKKLLKCQKHPKLPLYIWNYDNVVQFKRLWDNVTLECRGLITDKCGKIVARSFKKFFNVFETKYIQPDQKNDDEELKTFTLDTCKIFEKWDGSLCILFFEPDSEQWIVASRGGFNNKYVKRAEQILTRQHPNYKQNLDKEYSYVFELIYPGNRMIVDYKNKEALIYLSSFSNITGEENFQPEYMNKCGFEAAHPIEHSTLNLRPGDIHNLFDLSKQLMEMDSENKEGYVVCLPNGKRFKIKFNKYMEINKTNSKLTINTIFEWFSANVSLKKIAEYNIPDEFMPWVKQKLEILEKLYYELLKPIEVFYNDYQKNNNNNQTTHDTKLFIQKIKEDNKIAPSLLIAFHKQMEKNKTSAVTKDNIIRKAVCKFYEKEMLSALECQNTTTCM